MPKPRSYYYLVDGLDSEKGGLVKRALESVPDLQGVVVSAIHGVIKVRSPRDPLLQVRMACEITGITLRTELKRRHLISKPRKRDES